MASNIDMRDLTTRLYSLTFTLSDLASNIHKRTRVEHDSKKYYIRQDVENERAAELVLRDLLEVLNKLGAHGYSLAQLKPEATRQATARKKKIESVAVDTPPEPDSEERRDGGDDSVRTSGV